MMLALPHHTTNQLLGLACMGIQQFPRLTVICSVLTLSLCENGCHHPGPDRKSCVGHAAWLLPAGTMGLLGQAAAAVLALPDEQPDKLGLCATFWTAGTSAAT
jgi:hypothetical protein